jgi:hypothetical protein
MLISRVSGSGEVCGRAPRAIIGAALASVVGQVVAVEHRDEGHRPRAFLDQQLQELQSVVLEHRDLPRERDLDRALAALLERVGVGLQLGAARVAAGERPALEAQVLVEDRAREAERAGVHGFAEQRLYACRLLAGGGPLHGSLAHDVVPERRERREKGEIERRIPARGGVEILRKALPVPRDARIEHLERNRLHVDEVAHRDLARLRPAWRDAHAAVAHHDRGHPVPRRRRHRAVPADLRVVVRVRIDEARRDDQAIRVEGSLRGPADILPDLEDLSRGDRDIGMPRRRARSVDDGAVPDQKIEHCILPIHLLK